jgi:sec-independent protein translocase protein TatA
MRMPGIGPPELLIVLVIVLIFFGVGRLGEVGGALGKGLREFRRASSGDLDEAKDKASETTEK